MNQLDAARHAQIEAEERERLERIQIRKRLAAEKRERDLWSPLRLSLLGVAVYLLARWAGVPYLY